LESGTGSSGGARIRRSQALRPHFFTRTITINS
jgi:hypothetical protein